MTTTLFETKETNVLADAANARTLEGSTQLVATANAKANSMMATMVADLDTYSERLKASQTNAGELDSLVDALAAIEEADVAFLRTLSSDGIVGMLKSQQSKRSRCKGKLMDEENYKNMLSAAIAEAMLRMVLGKEKAGGRLGASVVFSEEKLAYLAKHQEDLRRELRNVQSKKSIAKSKAGFDPSSAKWQELLVAEAQLKDIRVDLTATKTDETREFLKELLAEVDPNNTKAADLKQLMESIKTLAFADVTTEESEEK